MASPTRQDLTLMPQRSAGFVYTSVLETATNEGGSRTVADADFGRDLGLGNNRQERQKMRQRGAASRKIDNVDFGLSFPSSTRSLRHSSRTPQTRRSTSRQPSEASARRSREPSTSRSIRQHSIEPASAQSQVAQLEPDGRSFKRRRLSQSAVTPKQPAPAPPKTVSSARSSMRRNSGRIFTIAEDEGVQVETEVRLPEPQTSPLFVPQSEPDKENDTPQDPSLEPNLPDTEFKNTVLGRGLPKEPTYSVLNSRDISVGGHATNSGKEDAATQEEESQAMESGQSSSIVSSLPAADAPAPPKRQKKQRKGRRLTFDRKKRRSSRQDENPITQEESSAAAASSRAVSEEPSPTAQPLANRISRYSRFSQLGRPGVKRDATPASHRDRSPRDSADEEDGTYIQHSSPEPETPAATKKASKQTRRRAVQEGSSQPSRTKTSRPTFPVLTHRLTNIPTLSAINEDEEVVDQLENDQDGLNSLPNDRTQPNVVDVLAQICRETIANMMDHMLQDSPPSERATLKNKRNALEAFGKDLEDELFEMSEAVENRINLEARVRKSRREKSALQTQWVELRKEREQIALKCDAVRRRHWESEDDAREKWNLSEAVRRVEREMERDDGEGDDGLEFLLRSVADAVSSASEHGGTLDRVKSFNMQLESMALFLERRG